MRITFTYTCLIALFLILSPISYGMGPGVDLIVGGDGLNDEGIHKADPIIEQDVSTNLNAADSSNDVPIVLEPVIDELAPIKLSRVLEYMNSKSFEPHDFQLMWDHWFSRQVRDNTNQGEKWLKKLDKVLYSAVTSNSPLVFRTVLELEYPGMRRTRIFNPNRALFMVVKSSSVNEEAAAKMARLLMEYGGNPLLLGTTRDPELAKLTIIEITIRRKKPLVLNAFLAPPSPISFDVLEEMTKINDDTRRRVDLFRTRVVRELHTILREEKLQRGVKYRGGRDEAGAAERMMDVLVDDRILIFAERYLTMYSWFISYFLFVFLTMFFMYHVRVKRVPEPDVLLMPRETSWWAFLYYTTSTLCTGVPRGTPFEFVGYGLATGGSILWCQLWTFRIDLALVLLLAVLVQTSFTLLFYITYAPTVAEDVRLNGLPPEGQLHRVMHYAKRKDMTRAINKTLQCLVACSLSFYLLLCVLDPVQKMYSCPSAAISDTYGFAYSLSRTVTMTWDVVVFFMLSLRLYRVIDTVIVLDLARKCFQGVAGQGQEAVTPNEEKELEEQLGESIKDSMRRI